MGYRYIGSKEKLADKIVAEIRRIDPEARQVIDLMAGTGLLSLALRKNSYQVTAVDVMTYTFHHLNVHLFLAEAPKFDGTRAVLEDTHKTIPTLFPKSQYGVVLDHLNSLEPVEGYFYREFSPGGVPSNASQPRKYFTSENAAKVDAVRSEIKRFRASGAVSELEHSLLLHDLIMATNDVANIAGTYGHYLSKFVERAKSELVLKPHCFSSVGLVRGHTVIRDYAEAVASKLEADLCYIDPPYMKRQYAANYHVLETLAREDEPEAVGKSGLRPWRDQYSNFCTKTKIRDSWDTILTQTRVKNFLISYSEDGLLSIDDLAEFLDKYGEVTVRQIEHKRFKSNDSLKPGVITEYLIRVAVD